MMTAKDSAKHYAMHNKRLLTEREQEIAREAYEFGFHEGVRQAELCYIYGSRDFLDRIKELRG